ncbi:MAG: fatty acid desaturase [Leptospiraceae bacterium]|nr:fatty acid desaturase [Leptospiraceae bacterium]
MKNQGIHYSPEEVESFGKEIKSIYEDLKSKVGEEDLLIAKDINNSSKLLEGLGRILIGSGNPLFVLPGSFFLGLHYTVEFSQGHNILHGQYDDIPDNEKFQSSTWNWKNTMDPEDWKYEHHVVHHPYTNVVGKDNDFGFLVYRASNHQRWEPIHLFQLPIILTQPLITTFFFPWYVSTSRAIAEKRDIFSLETYGRSIERIIDYFAKNYFLFPLVSPGNSLIVGLGNFLGKTFSNYHLQFILGASHLGTEPEAFPERFSESEFEFYLRQVLSTANYEVWEPTEFIYGGINTHLEHHLFPDLPPNRLKEASPKVREVCERYGVPYHTGPFINQIIKLVENVIYKSLPTRPEDNFHPLELLIKPETLFQRLIDGVTSFFNSSPSIYHSEDLFINTKVIKKKGTIGNKATVLKIQIPDSWKLLDWEAGSYISLKFIIGGKDYVRQYSLIEPSRKNSYYEICVKRIPDGKVSNYIADKLKTGDSITLVGKPKGDFVLRHLPRKNLFIAAGVGITPIMAMLRRIRQTKIKNDSILLYFNNTTGEIIFHDDINYLASKDIKIIHIIKNENFNLVSANKSLAYFQGMISEELLEDKVPDYLDRHIFICGPESFMDSTREILKNNSYDFKNYHFENFNPKEIEKDPEKEKIIHSVTFHKSKKKININENTTLLKSIQMSGIKVPTGCLRGMCKACSVKKIEGRVLGEDKNSKVVKTITTCNNIPCSDVVLDL